MSVEPIIIPILVICASIFCFFYYARKKKDIAKIKDIHTYKIKDIVSICNTVKEEMGTGGYLNMMVAVDGTIKDYNLQRYEKDAWGTKVQCVMVENNQFYVKDDTGTILVRVDKPPSFHGNNSRPLLKEDTRTSSTKIIETINTSIYVVGEVSDASGELVIQKPKDEKGSFIVALASKEEFIKKYKSYLREWIIAGVLALIFGIILLYYIPSNI
jgi:hypothetical protein